MHGYHLDDPLKVNWIIFFMHQQYGPLFRILIKVLSLWNPGWAGEFRDPTGEGEFKRRSELGWGAMPMWEDGRSWMCGRIKSLSSLRVGLIDRPSPVPLGLSMGLLWLSQFYHSDSKEKEEKSSGLGEFRPLTLIRGPSSTMPLIPSPTYRNTCSPKVEWKARILGSP